MNRCSGPSGLVYTRLSKNDIFAVASSCSAAGSLRSGWLGFAITGFLLRWLPSRRLSRGGTRSRPLFLVGVDGTGPDRPFGRGHRLCGGGERFAGLAFNFLRMPLELAHLLLKGHAQVGRMLAEFRQGLAQGAAEFGQLARPEDNQGQDNDNDHLR